MKHGMEALRATRPDTGTALSPARPTLSWQPALHRVSAFLEQQGFRPDDAERLSRSIVVNCARHAQPGSSEEATGLALDEAKTLALGFVTGLPCTATA